MIFLRGLRSHGFGCSVFVFLVFEHPCREVLPLFLSLFACDACISGLTLHMFLKYAFRVEALEHRFCFSLKLKVSDFKMYEFDFILPRFSRLSADGRCKKKMSPERC